MDNWQGSTSFGTDIGYLYACKIIFIFLGSYFLFAIRTKISGKTSKVRVEGGGCYMEQAYLIDGKVSRFVFGGVLESGEWKTISDWTV